MSLRKGILSVTFRALMLFFAGCLILCYLSVFFNPARAWVMTLFGLLYVPLLLLNIFLLVWALICRSRAFLIPLVALLPSVFLLGRYFQISAPDSSGEDSIKIVSYNVGRFSTPARRFQGEGQAACADSVTEYLKSVDPDIICFQEVQLRDASAARSWVASRFPGYYIEYYIYPDNSGAYGNLTLSRFPIRDKGKLDFGKSSNLAIWSEYEIAGRRIRVYNCHFQSYSISLSRVAKSLSGDYRKTVADTEEKMKASIKRRPEQVEAVIKHAQESAVPSVVAGDFNDNPLSYTYWRLSRGRKDTFVEAGKGAGATYRGLWPLLRIDYILYPEEFRAVSHSVPHKSYSDHYPIIAEIAL